MHRIHNKNIGEWENFLLAEKSKRERRWSEYLREIAFKIGGNEELIEQYGKGSYEDLREEKKQCYLRTFSSSTKH